MFFHLLLLWPEFYFLFLLKMTDLVPINGPLLYKACGSLWNAKKKVALKFLEYFCSSVLIFLRLNRLLVSRAHCHQLWSYVGYLKIKNKKNPRKTLTLGAFGRLLWHLRCQAEITDYSTPVWMPLRQLCKLVTVFGGPLVNACEYHS